MRALLVAALLAGHSSSPSIPDKTTPIEELPKACALQHAEVIQVRRDFGKPKVNVALDAWMAPGEHKIEALQLWWTDPKDRYPFGRLARAHLKTRSSRLGPAHWRMELQGDGQTFSFDVELEADGPAAYATVVLPDGSEVPRCRGTEAKLHARKFLGIPVGLRAMVVTCTAPNGATHRAPIKMTPVAPN